MSSPGAAIPRRCPEGKISERVGPCQFAISGEGLGFTPFEAVLIRGIAVFVPGSLDFYMCGRIPDPGMGRYPTLAPQTPGTTAYQ